MERQSLEWIIWCSNLLIALLSICSEHVSLLLLPLIRARGENYNAFSSNNRYLEAREGDDDIEIKVGGNHALGRLPSMAVKSGKKEEKQSSSALGVIQKL